MANMTSSCILVVVVQSLSCVRLFETPWTATHQCPPSFTIYIKLFKIDKWCLNLIFQRFLTERASQLVLVVKNLPANAGGTRDVSSIPGSGRSLE